MLPALLALDARAVVLDSIDGERTIPVDALVTTQGRTVLQPGQALVRIELPDREEVTAFRKLGERTHVTIAKLSVAVAFRLSGRNIAAPRVAMGAVARRAFLSAAGAAALKGRPLTEETFVLFSKTLSQEIAQAIPTRESMPYKRAAVRGVTDDLYQMLSARAEKNSALFWMVNRRETVLLCYAPGLCFSLSGNRQRHFLSIASGGDIFSKSQGSRALCKLNLRAVVLQNLTYIKHLVEVEINAATDNPLIFPKGDGHYEFLSGGNFHGEPTGFAMDLLTMSLAEIGNVADRRCFTLCDPTLSYGLPLALAGEPIGLNYGYNIICCSTSALASENKTLCFPSVCDNIPTKANQEDHVSMAPWATRKCQLVIKNLEKILGIELLLASRGIYITDEKLGQFKLGKGTSIAYAKVTERIKFQHDDFYMRDQSKATIGLIESDELLEAVEAAVGEL